MLEQAIFPWYCQKMTFFGYWCSVVWRKSLPAGETLQVKQVTYRSVLYWHCRGLREGFQSKVNTSNTLVKVDIFQYNESKVSAGQGKTCRSKDVEVKGEDWLLWFQESCEWILAYAMQPSGMFEDPTPAALSAGFNPIAILPPCQLTCQHLLLLACSLSWETVVMPELQVDPPGRALSSPFFVPRRGSRGGERSGERRRGEEEDRLSPAVGSFTHPSLPPSLFSPRLPAFLWTCVLQYKCAWGGTHMHTHTHTHKHTYSISPCFCVVPLSDRRTKTRCFWRGWPSLQSILPARRH